MAQAQQFFNSLSLPQLPLKREAIFRRMAGPFYRNNPQFFRQGIPRQFRLFSGPFPFARIELDGKFGRGGQRELLRE